MHKDTHTRTHTHARQGLCKNRSGGDKLVQGERRRGPAQGRFHRDGCELGLKCYQEFSGNKYTLGVKSRRVIFQEKAEKCEKGIISHQAWKWRKDPPGNVKQCEYSPVLPLPGPLCALLKGVMQGEPQNKTLKDQLERYENLQIKLQRLG